jgi:hypothetical protein
VGVVSMVAYNGSAPAPSNSAKAMNFNKKMGTAETYNPTPGKIHFDFHKFFVVECVHVDLLWTWY